MNYKPVNDKGDFIYSGCLFLAGSDLYTYSGVVHDDETVYGVKILGVDGSEHKFKFSEIETVYTPHNPND